MPLPMLSGSHNLEVLQTVVGRILIDVVNQLVGSEVPADVLLDRET